jgi:hypothetical protein
MMHIDSLYRPLISRPSLCGSLLAIKNTPAEAQPQAAQHNPTIKKPAPAMPAQSALPILALLANL